MVLDRLNCSIYGSQFYTVSKMSMVQNLDVSQRSCSLSSRQILRSRTGKDETQVWVRAGNEIPTEAAAASFDGKF
jgi:hypothetical protein